jgi:DNA-binding NtrC family response regulator
LAILDVVMPGMHGSEAYKQMLRERPPFPVIFVSGYSLESDSLLALRSRNVRFLAKPYSPKTLGQVVRQILDHNRRENAPSWKVETAAPHPSGGDETLPPAESEKRDGRSHSDR